MVKTKYQITFEVETSVSSSTLKNWVLGMLCDALARKLAFNNIAIPIADAQSIRVTEIE